MPEPAPTPPLPCACTTLRKSGRALSRRYHEALEPCGLRVTQYALLAALARAGSLPLTALADELVMDRTTLSRNLLPLEHVGLVRVDPGEDRRIRVAQLTPAGQKRLDDARPLWRAAQDEVTESFGRERLDALLREISAFTAATR